MYVMSISESGAVPDEVDKMIFFNADQKLNRAIK